MKPILLCLLFATSAMATDAVSWGHLKSQAVGKTPAPVTHIYKTPDGRTLRVTSFHWTAVFAQAPYVQNAAMNISIGDNGHFTMVANMRHFVTLLDAFKEDAEGLGFADPQTQDILFLLFFRVLENRYFWDSPYDDRHTPVPEAEYRRIISYWRAMRR